MPTVNIAQITSRPGVYVKEFDNSVIASNTAQGLTNLVIGVSKTGPINTPVLITNTTDLQNIFGGIDRGLERNGSYFQRTIAQMLLSSPVYAINLLETNDTLDQIEYAPLSTATDKTNDVIKTGPYMRFYNTTGFWKLDTDSFLSLTSNNTNNLDRLFNITNTSSNYISVFIFKTTIKGYDTPMINYYGTIDNMPPYVYPTDWVSDYMVDVVVLSGDWSNYGALSVDPIWSKYFDSTGLLKDQVVNFTNNANVKVLSYYQGLSFIPYFKNNGGQDKFIETVINRDTAKTGLFCAFNIDAMDTSFPAYKVDLIGNNLLQDDSFIDVNNGQIDFLSYNEKITEIVPYTDTILDRPGNVISMISGDSDYWDNGISNLHRTSWYAEDILVDIRENRGFTYSSTTASVTYELLLNDEYNGINDLPYAIIGGNNVNITGPTVFTFSSLDFGSSSVAANYFIAYKLDSTGVVSQVIPSGASAFPSVSPTDIVLGYTSVRTQGGAFTGTPTYTDVSIDTNFYVDLLYGTDYTIESLGSNNTFKLTFLDTAAVPSTSKYAQYRRFKRFNAIKNILESTNVGEAVLILDLGDGLVKNSLSTMEIISIVTSTTANKSITIQTNLGLSESDFNDNVINGLYDQFVLYAVDDELIFSDYKMITTNTIDTDTDTGTASYGIVAKYSKMYLDFYNGIIDTGDYFYANILQNELNNFIFTKNGGNNYIILEGTGTIFDISTYNAISVPDSVLNTGVFTVHDQTNVALSIFGLTDSNTVAYKVAESVVEETLSNVTIIYDATNKYYLSMSIDSSNDLTVYITDDSLVTPNLMGDLLQYNQTLNIVSKDSNYEETIELVIPSGYTQPTLSNKIIISGSRYTEVVVGDFLEAYVDESTLVDGQVPKRLTRILSKKVYTGDSSLSVITCDATINVILIGSTYQTKRYTALDKYITTYKSIPLKGFRIRSESLPNNTDTRQTEILDLVGLGTPLFNAIINKEAFIFRYLIDSFGLGLTENSKQQLMDICGGRLDCFGFLNMPSIKQFRLSSSPTFVDSEGVLQTSFIAAGGDINSNPAFLYSFGQGPGTSCVGYFIPYVTANDNGRPINIPPAMYVATTYMQKLNSNVTTTVPWTIAAGITNGRVLGISGLEMDFSPDDISNLNGAMMNPLVIKKNRGWVIDTENTAQTLYKSSLSYIHSRELLIELENALTDMLKTFQWKFNTPDIRAEIKLRADNICAGFASKNGLNNYFNKCDAENNTNELIDNQIGVLDTYIEIVKGLGYIINNITVLRTGAIASGGFQTL